MRARRAVLKAIRSGGDCASCCSGWFVFAVDWVGMAQRQHAGTIGRAQGGLETGGNALEAVLDSDTGHGGDSGVL